LHEEVRRRRDEHEILVRALGPQRARNASATLIRGSVPSNDEGRAGEEIGAPFAGQRCIERPRTAKPAKREEKLAWRGCEVSGSTIVPNPDPEVQYQY
jgi:hypothetical protein